MHVAQPAVLSTTTTLHQVLSIVVVLHRLLSIVPLLHEVYVRKIHVNNELSQPSTHFQSSESHTGDNISRQTVTGIKSVLFKKKTIYMDPSDVLPFHTRSHHGVSMRRPLLFYSHGQPLFEVLDKSNRKLASTTSEYNRHQHGSNTRINHICT